MEEKKKISFFANIKNCICNLEKYPEMAARPFNTVLKYWLKVIAIFTIVVSIVSIYGISKDLNSGIEYFKNEIPDLEFKDNKLSLKTDETVKVENEESFIKKLIIDTNDITDEQIEEYKTEIGKSQTGALLLTDKIIVNTGSGLVEYSYETIAKSYNIGNMTKDDMINYFSGSNLVMIYGGIFIMSYLYLFIAYLFSTLLDAFILGTLGYVTALLLRLKIKYVAMIKTAIHALTLPIILNLIYIVVQSLFGFEIKYFEIMYIAVAYIYIIAAILMIKSDFVKKGQELNKIIEEQQRVKEELERQKEEQKQKEEEEQRKKEQEKKDKKGKKEKKDNNDGLEEEPEGGNA